MNSTVNKKEIENFAKDSNKWWDLKGPFAPLHKLNATRLKYFKQQICAHFDRDIESFDTYKDLTILDVGCGGGLVCEPLSRLNATVTGIDADAKAIAVAQEHANDSSLDIQYHAKTTTDLVKDGQKFDVVLALEIIEHVDNPEQFVKEVVSLCKPNGLVIFSTLNRNPKSFALGIIAAEYILGWVPKGTHNWKKFVKPSELSKMLRNASASPHDICGLRYNPLSKKFSLDKNDLDVNYFITAKL